VEARADTARGAQFMRGPRASVRAVPELGAGTQTLAGVQLIKREEGVDK
jgi:hypothetical protein